MVTITQLKKGARERKYLEHNSRIFRMSTKKRNHYALDTIKPKKPNSAQRKTARFV